MGGFDQDGFTGLVQLKHSLEETRPMARAAAVSNLIALGDEETIAFVRMRMEDEFDPLVLRMYREALEE
ncbi:MAG: hypothetical protein KJ970_09990 [Candidatus Eisenbacteria bacterium]|uniref:HEAT repeat domain-containing protein n=1 Tax=Eiseniibacteriota bacterium TaxID=2212470 RepID=A0A948RZU2_UNCEI|nr:hypothetical protein [Candidatus Eisenbacteria bacterium]MBU1947650.1 hypothetical protein [Candidatus Eisenbacteria bacterium]MBU2691249.1 hypothetical protein [Candidatus Eisenbacteria bacterium]